MYNINAGYGRHSQVHDFLGGGQVFVVASSSVNTDILKQMFKPYAGLVRYAATLQGAIDQCVANRGDRIYVAPGHTETVTATNIDINTAGVQIICLGTGLRRPTFTYGAAAATITVSAANCSFKGGHFIANFDNVAAAFTLAAAKDFVLEENTFDDNTAALHFLSIVVTNATDQDAEGLQVLRNRWNGLALAPNAFISILAATDRLIVDGNRVYMDATNDVGHFITLAGKVILEAQISGNRLIVVGVTTAAVGVFLTGSATTSKGIVEHNYVASLDTTGELFATAGTGLSFFENYYTGVADASGKLWPAVDAA